MSAPLLEADDVVCWFKQPTAWGARLRGQPMRRTVAVDRVSLDVQPGEIVGIVGESGSGKSTLARCLVGLLHPQQGQVRLAGVDLRLTPRSARRRVQMVFQDPYTSLNPYMRVGAAVLEPGQVHRGVGRKDADAFVARHLGLVGLDPTIASRWPRELSGGQRQRLAIARALAVEPDVLLADEVVSALDMSVQAQILNMLADLRTELGLAIVFIAHQLSAVRAVCDRLAVMYMGQIVESGSTEMIFASPQHPYTAALLAAHPDPVPGEALPPLPVLTEIAGSGAAACRYESRCPHAVEACHETEPILADAAPEGAGRLVRCHVRPFAGSVTT